MPGNKHSGRKKKKNESVGDCGETGSAVDEKKPRGRPKKRILNQRSNKFALIHQFQII